MVGSIMEPTFLSHFGTCEQKRTNFEFCDKVLAK